MTAVVVSTCGSTSTDRRERAPRSCRSSRSPPKHATMPPWLGGVLAALGVFLTVGFLTIVGSAVRESVLPPGVEPDKRRRRRARFGIGGHRRARRSSCSGAATSGGRPKQAVTATLVLYRPFTANASVTHVGDRETLTLAIRDPRWTGTPNPLSSLQRAAPRSRQADAPVSRSRAGARCLRARAPGAAHAGGARFRHGIAAAACRPLPRATATSCTRADTHRRWSATSTCLTSVSTAGPTRTIRSSPASRRREAPHCPFRSRRRLARDVDAEAIAPLVAGEERVLAFKVRDAAGAC